MKKILTSSITDSAQLPILKRTIDHIQEMEMENIKSAIYASLGSSNDSTPIVLWGCVGTLSTVTVSNDTLTVTAGAFIYNGEIYQISAQSITKTGANVFTLSLDTTTFQAGEPTIYSDGATSVNTNQNLKIKLSQGLTGSGICDWDNRKFYNSDVDVNSISFPNAIIDSIDTPSGATLTGCVAAVQKRGDVCTLSLNLSFSITNATTFKSFADLVDIVLNSKFRKKPSSHDMWVPAIGQNSESASWNCEASWRFDGSQIECYKSYSQGVVNNSNSFNYRFQITYAL